MPNKLIRKNVTPSGIVVKTIAHSSELGFTLFSIRAIAKGVIVSELRFVSVALLHHHDRLVKQFK